jgi:DNA mismatch repair protein MutS
VKRSPRLAAPAEARGEAVSPLMRQYLGVKREHPDALVFFRLGDFYELFFEDAVEASALLGLTLTSRNKHAPEPVPMCGVPWHQRDAYVTRLLRLGRKIAICDQLEDPAAARGLVQRGVTEVLTPGTVMGEALLDSPANQFLAALWPDGEAIGICLADASTGEVKLAECPWNEAATLLSRPRVPEWLTPRAADLRPAVAQRLAAQLAALGGARSELPAASFDADAARLARWSAWDAALARVPMARRAAAAALEYLDRVMGAEALRFARLERWSERETLRYDAATARHLELFEPQPGGVPEHTLWRHLDLTRTAPGARRLRAWLERPLAEVAAIRARHDRVAEWLAPAVGRERFREALRGLPDLERLIARLACLRATPRDLGALRLALEKLPEIVAALPDHARSAALEPPTALAARLRAALVDEPPPVSRDGGVMREGFDALRDELNALAHSGKRWIAELEAAERERTGIGSLKIGYNRVFGYYLEVTRAHLERVPPDYERRQTLTGAERFVTPALKVKEGEVLSAEERLKAREHELFVALRAEAAAHTEPLRAIAAELATRDAEAALAEAAARQRWVRPEIEDSDRLQFAALRHPVVERLLPAGEFVPNDLDMSGSGRQILLVTGPNMGGKSTYLRQAALAVLLAQAGSFVPAERAVVGCVDRLFTRVGAADRLGSGQSTFLVEMSETADILRGATPRSFVLLDEIGRGTSTYDGLALAWAVTEFLHASQGPRPRTVFATHYHELTQLAGRLARLVNVQVAVRESGDHVVFLHRVIEGAADRSYGIQVARLAGLPPAVIARAREVLHELEAERTVEHLEGGPAAAGRHGSSGAAPATERGASEAARQGALFESREHPIEAELRGLDLDQLTPLEALRRLSDWKARLRGAGPAGR